MYKNLNTGDSSEEFSVSLEKNTLQRSSAYESLVEILMKDSAVTWEYKGVIARVRFDEGRISGSLKPKLNGIFTNPLHSAETPTLESEKRAIAVEMFAWLEAEILTSY